MRKRISLLVVALMMALTMSFGGVAFADTSNLCQTHPEHKQCEKFGPGNSENTAAFGKNPNTGVDRDNPSPNN